MNHKEFEMKLQNEIREQHERKIKKPRLFISIGCPASGKSSFFTNSYILSKDKIRFMLYNYENTGKDFDSNDELLIDMLFIKCLKLLLINAKDIYVDCGNLLYLERQLLREIAKEYSFDVIYVRFHASLEQCLHRNRNRTRKVPESVIIRKFNSFESFTSKELNDVKLINVK